MSFGINTSLSGMLAAQKGMQVSTENLLNMKTEGYVRQKVNYVENTSSMGPGVANKIGSGVIVEDIVRVTDYILTNNYNNQNSVVSYYKELQSVLSEVETIMGDYTDGKLSKLTVGFFDAWEEYSKFPEESSYRFALVGETQKLTEKLNEVGSEIGRITFDTMERLKNHGSNVNQLVSNIAQVNERIIEAGPNVPNGLLNERDKLITQLSEQMDIEVSYESKNPEVVTVRSGGTFLVDKDRNYDIRLMEKQGGYFFSNGISKLDISSGSIKASFELLGNHLSKYIKQVDTITSELITNVNAIHSNGFSINGDTGIDFFVGSNSKDIAINPLLMADVSKIASTETMGVEGNTEVAKDIYKVKDIIVDNNLDFRNYVNGVSMEMAQDLNFVNTQLVVQSGVLDGLETSKSSVEDVNMEEEMTNLMMFQKVFSANAKAINVYKETFDSLLQIV